MERLIFWIWKSLRSDRRQCRGFCPGCEHYSRCCKDGERIKVKVKARSKRIT